MSSPRTLKGFTLVELVIAVTILAILAAVAIPAFQSLQGTAKDAATKKALAGLRDGIQLHRALQVASGAQPGTPGIFPDNGCPAGGDIMPPEQPPAHTHTVMEQQMVPKNPWAQGVVPAGRENWIRLTSDVTGTGEASPTAGWAYNSARCAIWANTAVNGAKVGLTENTF